MEDLTDVPTERFTVAANENATTKSAISEECVPPRLVTTALADFVALPLPHRELVVAPVLPTKGLMMIFAERGVGKTHVSMGLGWSIACGSSFLRWKAPQPRRVLYVDGEMPQTLMQERARATMDTTDVRPPDKEYFRLLALDRQPPGVSLNLAREEDQRRLEAELGDTEVIVLDNLSTLVSGGRENDAESWDTVQAWLLRLRRSGVSVILVHHAGRSGQARGTSKREDVLDTVVQLKRPLDYAPGQGARFEVHLTKARGVFGADAEPFEARLTQADGRSTWQCSPVRDGSAEEVESLLAEGLSVRDVADRTGLSKSQVHRIKQASEAKAA
ncbi:MAG TPA: AAA family ATPase [Beijerinckiaceae bacterium]|jgi:putative DNA primase/helicase